MNRRPMPDAAGYYTGVQLQARGLPPVTLSSEPAAECFEALLRAAENAGQITHADLMKIAGALKARGHADFVARLAALGE